jgi:hypothetical protein
MKSGVYWLHQTRIANRDVFPGPHSVVCAEEERFLTQPLLEQLLARTKLLHGIGGMAKLCRACQWRYEFAAGLIFT